MKYLHKLIEAIARYRKYRVTFTQLSGLNDRMLDDLGIAPADIKSVAAGKFRPGRRVQRFAPHICTARDDLTPILRQDKLREDGDQIPYPPEAA